MGGTLLETAQLSAHFTLPPVSHFEEREQTMGDHDHSEKVVIRTYQRLSDLDEPDPVVRNMLALMAGVFADQWAAKLNEDMRAALAGRSRWPAVSVNDYVSVCYAHGAAAGIKLDMDADNDHNRRLTSTGGLVVLYDERDGCWRAEQ
jgi:hypothetical protein